MYRSCSIIARNTFSVTLKSGDRTGEVVPEILLLVCVKSCQQCAGARDSSHEIFCNGKALNLHLKYAYTSVNHYHQVVTKIFQPHMLFSPKPRKYLGTTLALLTGTGSQTSLGFSPIVGVPPVIKHNLSLITDFHFSKACQKLLLYIRREVTNRKPLRSLMSSVFLHAVTKSCR